MNASKAAFEQFISGDLDQVDQYLYNCDGKKRLPAHLPKYGTAPIIKIKQQSLIDNQSINQSPINRKVFGHRIESDSLIYLTKPIK
jgi:hypothetical protein